MTDKPGDTLPFAAWQWKSLLVFQTVCCGSYSILVHLCEVDGKIPFSSTSMVCIQESFKLFLSLSLLFNEHRQSEQPFQFPSWRICLPFAVPTVLYTINNNLAVHMQLHMDAATYQVLSNLKILTTAILYRIIIKRPISRLQWFALFLLTTAGVLNSYGGLQSSFEGNTSKGAIHLTLTGIAMLALYCTISGLAGVYSEYILKKDYHLSLHLQNSLLYLFGSILNGAFFIVTALTDEHGGSAMSLTKGFTFYTWLIIASQVFNGLIMSAVIKHSSNITRLFVISCSMLVTTVLSIALFSLQLNLFFSIAVVLVLVALYLYHK